MKWRNKNLGKNPSDPEFYEGYNPEEDYEELCDEQELIENLKKGK